MKILKYTLFGILGLAVLAALADWHWTEGMRPDTTSPVWPMEALRERLARTFSR